MFRKDAQPASKLWVLGSNPNGITIKETSHGLFFVDGPTESDYFL